MDDYITLGIIGLAILLAAGGVVFGILQRQRMVDDWGTFASRTGLTMNKGGLFSSPTVTGEFRRRQVNLNTYVVRVGRSSITYTRMGVSTANSSGARFTIESAGFLSKVGQALGMQDVKVGNEDFDNRFTIKSNPPDYVPMTFGSDYMIQGSISQMYDKNFKLILDGSGLVFSRRGVERDQLALERILSTLCDIGEKVDGRKASF